MHRNPFDDFEDPQPIYRPSYVQHVQPHYRCVNPYERNKPTYTHTQLPKLEVDASSVDIATVDDFLRDLTLESVYNAPKIPMAKPEPVEPIEPVAAVVEKASPKSPDEGTDVKVSPVKERSRRGKCSLMLHISSAFDRIRKITFMDINDDKKEVFEAVMCVDPASISISDSNRKYNLEVANKPIALHQEFRVKRNGSKYGKCSQRWKFSGKKFHYIRKDNGQKYKMSGEYAQNFIITNGQAIIAKVWDKKSSAIRIDINAKDTDLEHIIVMVTIMLLQRFSQHVTPQRR
jgi:hypothetical protein